MCINHLFITENYILLFRDSSFENLQYLNVDQSLADIATLIKAVQEMYNSSDSRVILSGSGYGGTLAAWARQRYPHLIYGVWSSSGIFEFAMDTKGIYSRLFDKDTNE